MILRQTRAILLDGYRELNARKLFWITLLISGLVVLGFGATSVTETGIGVLWFEIPLPFVPPGLTNDLWYKFLFQTFGVGIWLTWIAAILGLVTTAGIIPDFVSGGSVELSLSKPIGRVRLFLTKYLVGLLFMTLQVTIFAAGCFLVFGIRGGSWEPRIFLAIPIVVCFFSYLYCVCALIGLLTRSTITALLLTLLVWFLIFVVSAAELGLLSAKEQFAAQAQRDRQRAERMVEGTRQMLLAERRAGLAEGEEVVEPTLEEIEARQLLIADRRQSAESAEATAARLEPWHRALKSVKTALPKTGETTELLGRSLLSPEDRDTLQGMFESEGGGAVRVEAGDEGAEDLAEQRATSRQAADAVEQEILSRPVWWIVGTSLLFEAIVLGLACLIFARRDF